MVNKMLWDEQERNRRAAAYSARCRRLRRERLARQNRIAARLLIVSAAIFTAAWTAQSLVIGG